MKQEIKKVKDIKGFKVFNPDWTCRGLRYEVGKIFEEDVTPSTCDRGFHFCEKASDCFSYYDFNSENKVAEVVALGEVDSDGKKSCTNKIQIVREISWQELLTIVNTGKDCTGLCNTGSWNTGDRNTGSCNTGDRNTGSCNTGSWNKSSFNTGCFMTEELKISLFNKPSNWSYRDWLNSDARYLLNQIPRNVVKWICSRDMTDEEKAVYPTHETTGGYLKVLDESECGQLWWDSLEEKDRNVIKVLPNFDADTFEQCTGIKVSDICHRCRIQKQAPGNKFCFDCLDEITGGDD